MSVNRLFYTIKLESDTIHENKYDLHVSFEQALKSGLVISLADSQMLKTIRRVTDHEINREQLEQWFEERDKIKKKKNSKANRERINELQQCIYDMMYIPEYITVVMTNKKHYERMFKKGFKVNGEEYRRFSCSASQARVSTVAFIRADLKDKVTDMLDNGRNKTVPLAPSKYNAYFGLYSSAIKEVTKPRFCVVKDYNETQSVDVDFINETDRASDDIVEQKTLDIEFNRFDGSGLISPYMSSVWGNDLNEDYVPCQFCIRTSFTKGMLNEYDFVDWCKEENDRNYFIRDIWDNLIDLREIDVILSEGQVKLWNCWDSQEHFEDCCQKNGIVWGVTKYAPKEDKKYSTANYQFLQTLDLSNEQVEELCKSTVDYIQGISYDNIYYSLLFMLGENIDFGGVKAFMNCSDNYWLKTLILNHNLFNDKYTKEKIRDMIIKRIEQACLGKILVEGNFQCIVPDPYAYMEWIAGKKVKGLLDAGEAYCEFWSNKGVTQVDSLRSPLTHFSEHGINQLNNSEKAKKWYQYSYSGYIINVHDEFTMVHAGSDYDFDIIFTTNNQQFLDGCRKDQRVVTYAPKKPKKKLFTEEDLYVADTFSFGTKIGQITNVASTICAMIPMFKKESPERDLLEKRVAMCCAAQSREIK